MRQPSITRHTKEQEVMTHDPMETDPEMTPDGGVSNDF